MKQQNGWKNTRITHLLNISYPILQGPFGGGLSSAELVAEVSNAGGLGGYGAYQLEPESIRETITDIRKLTGGSFNMNLWVNDQDELSESELLQRKMASLVHLEPYFEEVGLAIPPFPLIVQQKRFEKQVEVLLEMNVPVASFVFGIPDSYLLKEFKKRGIITIGAATTLEEGLALDKTEMDLIVASGMEAGGHRPAFIRPAEESLTGTFVLTQQLAKHTQKPIISAGGIANSQGIKAALTLGAQAVQIGTAFLACEESGANANYRSVIFSEAAKQTILTRAFTGRLGRGTASTIAAALKETNAVLPFPLQQEWLKDFRREAVNQRKNEMITFWMGQIATEVKPLKARDLMQSLVKGMDDLL